VELECDGFFNYDRSPIYLFIYANIYMYIYMRIISLATYLRYIRLCFLSF